MKCREGSFADFCNLEPNTAGGKIAWTFDLTTDNTPSVLPKRVACASQGPFKTEHFYCFDNKYVWKCKSALGCNTIMPIDYNESSMWDYWVLIDSRPKRLESDSSSILYETFSKRKVQSDY